ncbi:MAG: 50S ribosomal protein L23 [Candidatus Hydrothermarchaeota archaeon]|nr:50S ribosomal protein L23 [Candidatus Hydrothermarchaeota archaeon]
MIIIHPDVTEKSMKLVESENKLVFVVSRDASKSEIKTAVEKLYEVKVADVNTSVTPRGVKKAYIKLTPEYKAEEVATRMGIF